MAALLQLLVCLRDIKAQMDQNCVNFKETETELTYDAPLKAPDPLLPSFRPTVSNLGVKPDRESLNWMHTD